jgi:IS4 transposase
VELRDVEIFLTLAEELHFGPAFTVPTAVTAHAGRRPAERARRAGADFRRSLEDRHLAYVLQAKGEMTAHEPEPVKYWISNLPADIPARDLVLLATARWGIEHDYRELKPLWAWTTSRAAPSPDGTATSPSSPPPTCS